MTDEGQVFTRQDAPPAPGPTSDVAAAVKPSGIPEAATPPPVPPEPTGETPPTPEQIREWQQAAKNRDEWQRANTRRAQELAEEQRRFREEQRLVYEFASAAQTDPRVQKLIEEYQSILASQGAPTPSAEEGQPPKAADPELARRLAETERRLEAFERARDLEWADRQYDKMRADYREITGKEMPYETFQRVQQDLARTGSVDPSSQMRATCFDEFRRLGGQAQDRAAEQAQQAATGTQVEGLAGGTQSTTLDLATTPPEVFEDLGRKAAGGTPDANYHPFIWHENEPR